MECFAPSGGHFESSEPLQHDEPMYELSLEHLELECFTQFGGNIDCGRILLSYLHSLSIPYLSYC
jgi:hypothetical protein